MKIALKSKKKKKSKKYAKRIYTLAQTGRPKEGPDLPGVAHAHILEQLGPLKAIWTDRVSQKNK